MIFMGETYYCCMCGETFAIHHSATASFCPCCGATDDHITLTVD